MPLILSRARVYGRATGPSLVKLSRCTSVGARLRPAALSRVAASPAENRRYNSNTAEAELQATSSDASFGHAQSIEDIRLQAEFAKNKDIREYLRKWRALRPDTLDPVRDISISDPSEPWVGNMVNFGSGEETLDDQLRLTDEDMSDFVDFGDEGEGADDYLHPGDLVAFRPNSMLRHAIYVRTINKQHQFYTHRGKWQIAEPKDVDFVVRGFTSPKSVSRLHPYFPDTTAVLCGDMQSTIEGGVPREAGAYLLDKINQFEMQSHALYRANSARFDNIYTLVAHKEKQLQMTLDELACAALEIMPEQVNDVIRFVVHRACRQYPLLIDSDRSSLFNHEYMIFPTPIAKMLDKVTTWCHEYQAHLVQSASLNKSPPRDHPMSAFIYKAQQLIRRSRAIRSPTVMASVGPSSQRFVPGQDGNPCVVRRVLTDAFTADDKLIIQFLQLWCIPPKRMRSSALQSVGSHIMRATGMYSTLDLNAGSAPLFLQEIGVFAPWENPRLLDADLSLSTPPPTVSEGDENSSLTDAMATLRKDWGELPVYCVDAVDAEEIDDGISLERIQGSEDTFWVRVHIANPSAYLASDHLNVQYASSRLQTLYVPDRTYPIFPKDLTQKNFSLAPGRPCLTFSAKMNFEGEVLETDVCNGTLQNVKYITHDKLRSILGVEPDESMEPLVVGGKMPRRSRPGIQDTVSPEDESTFHTLRKLMLGFREHRRQNGAMEWPLSMNLSVSMSAGNEPLPEPSMQVSQAGYYVGDPIIQLRPQQRDPHEVVDTSKHDLVSLLMNLACWVSAKWCAERNIPAVYDGTNYHPELPRLTRDNMSEYGGEGFFHLAAPRGVSSPQPMKHIPLGLDAYVKSTSPLRRFTDMLAHYQIEAALRFESENQTRFDALDPSHADLLPFSHAAVEEYISRTRWKHNRIRAIDHMSKQFWACMLFFRAFYFAECALPETFECLVHRPLSATPLAGTQYDTGFLGAITSLGLRCAISVPPSLEGVEILSVVEAKVTGVNMARSLVMMEATRLVKPFKRVGEWA